MKLTPQEHVNLARAYLLSALGTNLESLAREYLRLCEQKAKESK